MRALYETALNLTVVAVIALLVQGCASTGPADPARAARNEAGQAALEGMKNASIADDNPNSPWLPQPRKSTSP
jgi:hypothetical protein